MAYLSEKYVESPGRHSAAAPGCRQSVEQLGPCPFFLRRVDVQTEYCKGALQMRISVQPARECQG